MFASTGVKDPAAPPDKYVEALAGSDIQTNQPATNEAVERLNKQYTRKVDQLLPSEVMSEIGTKVDIVQLEQVLIADGTKKFAEPQKDLLQRIASKRASMQGKR